MSLKVKILLTIAALVSAFAIGRYTVSTKVITETKIVEVEKKVEVVNTDKNEHTKTVTIKKELPNGEKEETTTTETVADTKTTDNTTTDTDTRRDVVNSTERGDTSSVSLRVLAGYHRDDFTNPIIGGSIDKRIIGPFTAGLWGLSNACFGASLGVQF